MGEGEEEQGLEEDVKELLGEALKKIDSLRKDFLERYGDDLKELKEEAESFIKKRPLLSAAISAYVGFKVGKLLGRLK